MTNVSFQRQTKKRSIKLILYAFAVTGCVMKNDAFSTNLRPFGTRSTYCRGEARVRPTRFVDDTPSYSIFSKTSAIDSRRSKRSDASTPSTKQRWLSRAYDITGVLSAIAWIRTAFVALSFHPDPRFVDCTLRHNILTMSQAFAFPLPIAWACFEVLRQSANRGTLNTTTSRALNLGIAFSSLWLAAASAMPRMFAFGYDLYSNSHKIVTAALHAITAIFALSVYKSSSSSSVGDSLRYFMDGLWNVGPSNYHKNSSCYATGVVGLLYFAIQPVIAMYPLATVPTILGKRLSRPASAFTLLGAIAAYVLKERKHESGDEAEILEPLRAGIAWGTSLHLLLIFLKVVGVDGGGLIFPGRGLWEVYPAMISVPFATAASLAVHGILCFAAWTDIRKA